MILAAVGLIGHAAAADGVTVDNLRCEYRVNPLGIDELVPRLSWKIVATDRNETQTAYHIQAAGSLETLLAGKGDLWDTGRIASDQSVNVVYQGKELTSGQRVYWRVRVWDKKGEPSSFSESAFWAMGLLSSDDWKARWIGRDESAQAEQENELADTNWIWLPGENAAKEAPVGQRFFRRTFKVPEDRTIRSARFVVTADNQAGVYINGRQCGHVNTFKQAVRLDLTPHVHGGSNTLAVGVTNVGDAPNPAGLMGKIVIEFDDGQTVAIVTDDQWRSAVKGKTGWNERVFDDADWKPAEILGQAGMLPWNKVSMPADEERRLPARMLRREFNVAADVKRATAYICGLGYYELSLNGQKVGDHVLDPGYTDYSKRVLYATYDVTDRLVHGPNAVGVQLGNSRFYAPRVKAPFKTIDYGYPKLLCEIHVDFADGSRQTIVTDGSWKLTTKGPIRANNDYDGEDYDARMEMAGRDKPGFDDSSWQAADLVTPPTGKLAAQMNEPIKITKTIQPKTITQLQDDLYVYDLGQNMVGWVRLKVQGPRGTKVTLRFAESLHEDGTLSVENMRSCKVTDTYILKGDGVEVYEPRFTYHGFRYVELRGFPGKPDLSTIEGHVAHSSVERRGNFTCSNELINRIYHNIIWGIRGNLRSIPTDCPQRDERHGWLGDIATEARAEMFDFNMACFFTKWLNDIADSQTEEGSVPNVAPAFWPMYSDNVTWPSAYLIIPGHLYEQYGDKRVLERHFDRLALWMDYMSRFLEDGIMPRDTYGDWCVPPESPELIHSKDPARKTNGTLLGTTYFYNNLQLMAHYADILDRPADAARFRKLAATIKDAFNKRFFDADKAQYDNGTQTSCVLPLSFGMVPESHRQAVFDRLVDNIMNVTGGHLATGLIGGQWLMRALSDNGRPDVAYTIATQKAYPSWGYMAEKGATTIWELWNGDTANPAMNSRNHLMLVGDLGIWFYEYLAGIQADGAKPGFKHIIMKPVPVEGLSFARASHESLYGTISSDWEIEGDQFVWNVQVPPNTTATVYVPTSKPAGVTESGKPAAEAEGVKFVGAKDGRAVYEVGSGQYQFKADR